MISLSLSRQSVTAAMEWLLANESDPDIDKPLPGEDNDEGEVDAAPSEPTVPESDDQQGATGGAEGPRFKNILETIRAFQRREFRPNPIVRVDLIVACSVHFLDFFFMKKNNCFYCQVGYLLR